MSNDLIKAIMDTPMQDGLLTLLAKKDKKLAQYHDLQDPFRQGFMLAEDIVKEWAEKNFPLNSSIKINKSTKDEKSNDVFEMECCNNPDEYGNCCNSPIPKQKSNEGNVFEKEISQIYKDCWEDGDEVDYDAEGHAHYYQSKNYERTFNYEVFGKQMEEFYLENILKDENPITPIKNNEHNVWVKIENDLPPLGTMVDGYNKNWINEDFNPEGIREVFLHPHYKTWFASRWDNDMDCWVVDYSEPTHWKRRTPPNKNENPITQKSNDVGDDKWFKKLKQLWNLLNPKNICRDCADENGTCPTTNLPCDPQEAAIQTILKQKSIDVGDAETKNRLQKSEWEFIKDILQEKLMNSRSESVDAKIAMILVEIEGILIKL